MTEVLVASISGGHFPYQLAALTVLCQRPYRPDVCMGGSGGAVAIYCASAAQWKPAGILRVSSSLDHKLFIEEHDGFASKYMPSSMFSYFKGSAYKSSSLSYKLLERYFTPSSIQRDEIWVGAVNEGSGAIGLFCNKCYTNSLIRGENLNRQLHMYQYLTYMGGSMEKITLSLLATAAIPLLIEPVEIDGDHYVDCGISYGSPLTPLLLEVLALARTRKTHITYLSGYDIQSSKVAGNILRGDANLGDHLRTLPTHVVRSSIQDDRNCAYSILNSVSDKEPSYAEFDITEMDKVEEIKIMSRCSLVEIYPRCDDSINVFNFDGKDVGAFIEGHTSSLKVRMWWC